VSLTVAKDLLRGLINVGLVIARLLVRPPASTLR